MTAETSNARLEVVAERQAWYEQQIALAEGQWAAAFLDRWECGDDVPSKEHYVALWLAERAAPPPPSAPVGVEKVKKALERLDRTIEACAKLTQLLGDGQPHIDLISTAGGQAALAKEAIQRALDQQPAAVTVDGAVLYRACEVYAEITEDCMGLVRRRAMREALAVAQQPAIGEEIMVNAAHGVFTLLLQPSGLPSGPRFVVQVPAPEQKPASTSGAVNVVGMPEFDDLMDHIYEYGTTAEGVVERANAFARAVLAQYAPQQPAAVDEAYPTPRNRAEAVALARLALAHLGVIDAHIDAAIDQARGKGVAE